MKEFIVNKNSWHYRWLLLYNYLKDYEKIKIWRSFEGEYTPQKWYDEKYFDPQDFCSYWRKTIIFPFIRIFLNVVLLIPFFVSLAALVYNIIKNPIGGFYLVLGFAGFFAIVFIIGLISYLWTKSSEKLANKMMKLSDDDLMFTAYKSFKEKTCPMIKYDGDK